MRGLRGAGERPGDQPPLLVGRKHAARLKAGDESGVFGEELAPERPEPVLLGNDADLDAVARGAVIGGGRQRHRIDELALSVAPGVWFGVSGDGDDVLSLLGVALSSAGGTSASETVTGGGMFFLASASSSPGSEVVTGGGAAASCLGSAFSTGFGSAAATVTGAGFSAGLASAGLTTGVGFSGGGAGVVAGAAATASGFLGGKAGAAAAGSGGGAVTGLGGAVEASGPPFLSFGLMRALRSATCCDSSRIAC